MTAPILYCGDTALDQAASYLAGLLHRAGHAFDYVPSDRAVTDEQLSAVGRKLVILSDYPSARLTEVQHRRVCELVDGGCGLLMIGGWESFHGVGGDWDRSPVAESLPVTIQTHDDREQFDQGAILRVAGSGPSGITFPGGQLPWVTHPPLIGGMNRVVAKPGSIVALEAVPLRLQWSEGRPVLEPRSPLPALVLSGPQAAGGRRAVFLPDVAPHWIGGMVDWGATRVAAHAPGGSAVEVGHYYAHFVTALVNWTMGLDNEPVIGE